MSAGFRAELRSEDWPWASGAALPASAENQDLLVVYRQHLPPMIDWCGSRNVQPPCNGSRTNLRYSLPSRASYRIKLRFEHLFDFFLLPLFAILSWEYLLINHLLRHPCHGACFWKIWLIHPIERSGLVSAWKRDSMEFQRGKNILSLRRQNEQHEKMTRLESGTGLEYWSTMKWKLLLD